MTHINWLVTAVMTAFAVLYCAAVWLVDHRWGRQHEGEE